MMDFAKFLDSLSEKYGFTDAENRKCAEFLRSVGNSAGDGKESGEFEGEDYGDAKE